MNRITLARMVWLLPVGALLMGTPALNAQEGHAAAGDSTACQVLTYCANNWRTLPSDIATFGRQVIADNAVAVIVCIGGHGKPKSEPKTESNDVPPPPTGNGGNGGTGDPGTGSPGTGEPGTGPGEPGNQYPEPASIILGLVGAGSLVLYRRRQNKTPPTANS